MRTFALVVLAMFCATGAMAAAFTNGTFEDPYVTVKTATVPTAWTSYMTIGGYVQQLEPGGTQLPGSHQWFQQYTTATSSCIGGLYQTFDTVAGATYTLKGYAAAVHADMTAKIGYCQGAFGGTVTWLLTCPGSTDLLWHNFVTPVVASGTSMTIIVESQNTAPTAKTSRVTKYDEIYVPEPSSLAALVGGMVGLVGMIRRRK